MGEIVQHPRREDGAYRIALRNLPNNFPFSPFLLTLFYCTIATQSLILTAYAISRIITPNPTEAKPNGRPRPQGKKTA